MISPNEDSSPALENSKQRNDYTGNFIEDIDNSEELAAIEKDPTIFPNSTRMISILLRVVPRARPRDAFRDPT